MIKFEVNDKGLWVDQPTLNYNVEDHRRKILYEFNKDIDDIIIKNISNEKLKKLFVQIETEINARKVNKKWKN